MTKVVVYESRFQRTIDAIDSVNDDIYWATINAPVVVGVILTMPLRMLSDALEALPMRKVKKVVID